MLLEPVGFPDTDAFPYEFGFQQGRLGQAGHRDLVRPFVAHQHFGFDPVVFQGFHETVGCDGRPSYVFGCIDNENSHTFFNRFCKFRDYG